MTEEQEANEVLPVAYHLHRATVLLARLDGVIKNDPPFEVFEREVKIIKDYLRRGLKQARKGNYL
jgi:hypothetical protein